MSLSVHEQTARLHLFHQLTKSSRLQQAGEPFDSVERLERHRSFVHEPVMSYTFGRETVSGEKTLHYVKTMNCGLQSYLKALKESKKSNVTVTMMYLGQGLPGSAPDEMKVLQQICGGENICVFKGLVRPGGTALDPLTTLYILFRTARN